MKQCRKSGEDELREIYREWKDRPKSRQNASEGGMLSYSKWIMAGVVWFTLLVLSGILVLHSLFAIHFKTAVAPALAIGAMYFAWHIAMFAARQQFQRSRDLRLGIVATSLLALITGLLGMKFGESLGIVAPSTFSSHSLSFSIFMMCITAIAVLVISRRRFKR